MKKLKKSIFTLICIGAIAMGMALSASAADSWYVLNKNKANGSDTQLEKGKKEYTGVTVSGDNGTNARVTVALYKKGNIFTGDFYYGDDQTLSAGTNRHAWWFGGDGGKYHLYADANTNQFTTTGNFRNMP